MHSRSDNVKLKFYNDVNEIVDEHFESLRSRYQGNLETSIRESDFIFDSVKLMYYKCHKVNFRRCGSCIDSPGCIKREKKTIFPKNINDKCFQYAETVALDYEEIKWNRERVSNIKPFVNKYNWKGKNYPSKIDDSKTFEKNNLTVALDILYIKEKNMSGLFSQKLIGTVKTNNSIND